MISRKTPKADLENKRSTWRALGFIASLAFILIAISWTNYEVLVRQAINFEADLLEENYLKIINLKTAALFSASTKVGAILANRDNKYKEAIEFK